jgi:hypothetical protein
MPRALRHAADARRQVQHALALGDRELAQQEERLARLGGDPVGIAPAGIQVGNRRGGSPRCRCLGQEILDLERAQALVFTQLHDVHCCLLGGHADRMSAVAGRLCQDPPTSISTITMPKMVSNVLPMAYGMP